MSAARLLHPYNQTLISGLCTSASGARRNLAVDRV